MAISKLEVGVVPLGVGGDSLRSAAAKINENFSNTTHAASKIVGTGAEQVPLSKNIPSLLGTAATKDIGTGSGQVATWKTYGIEGTGVGGYGNSGGPHRYKARTEFGGGLSEGSIANSHETPAQLSSYNAWHGIFSVVGRHGSITTQAQTYYYGGRMFFRFRYGSHSGAENEWARDTWAEIYTDRNTTVGTNSEIIKSSPVLRVFKDDIEKIHEANDLDIEFIVNGVGDYTIKGTTGIRGGKEDWTINIPKDNHDNQLIAFTMEEEEGGIVHLKTYKRVFSMETFTFGPDLNTPIDIPDGRWVDLHFNDLPQEQSDEPIEVINE